MASRAAALHAHLEHTLALSDGMDPNLVQQCSLLKSLLVPSLTAAQQQPAAPSPQANGGAAEQGSAGAAEAAVPPPSGVDDAQMEALSEDWEIEALEEKADDSDEIKQRLAAIRNSAKQRREQVKGGVAKPSLKVKPPVKA